MIENKVADILLSELLKAKKEDLEYYIKNNKYLSDDLREHIQNITKIIIRYFWKDIEAWLTNPEKIYNIVIEKRPDFKDILSTEEGINWFNSNVERTYNLIYNYAWG